MNVQLGVDNQGMVLYGTENMAKVVAASFLLEKQIGILTRNNGTNCVGLCSLMSLESLYGKRTSLSTDCGGV